MAKKKVQVAPCPPKASCPPRVPCLSRVPCPPEALRQRAAEKLRTSRTDISGMATEDIQSLIHELQLHQVELEIQNEELRQTLIDLAEQNGVEPSLRESEERLNLALAASELGLWDTNLLTSEMVVDEHWAAMLGYELNEIEPNCTFWESLVHPDDLTKVMRARSRHIEGHTASYQNEHRLRTKSGEWKWIRSRGRVTQHCRDGRPLRLVGTHRDITERKRLEREVVEAAAEEQRRLGQELHDGIGGELTGLGFMVQGLIDDLRPKATTEAATAAKIGEEIDRVIEQVRLLSRGLNPVEIDRQGLDVALEELAAHTSQLHGIPCEYHRNELVEVEDNFVAGHLYRIAQEAVTNAVKHGEPGRVLLTLESADNRLLLRVIDDGIGITTMNSMREGSGLRNMQYRAGLIGADLRVEPGDHGGTLVSCYFTSERID